MKVTITPLPQSKTEITIELSNDELDKYRAKAAEKLSKDNPVKGFRPGHTSADVLERQFGKDRVLKETLDLAVKESYVKALLEHNVKTVAEPQVELLKTPPEDSLKFKAVAPVLPEIKLPDLASIHIKHTPAKVEDKEVENSLETLRKSRASYKAVARPAQKGDRVEIDFTAKVDGVPLEGGESKQHPLIIGEGHFMDGFEDQLVGMKESETKEFSLRAPKNYPQAQIAGKEIEFKVSMRQVQSVDLPNLNDSFAKNLGKFNSLKALKQSIHEGLRDEKEARAREKTRLAIVERIIEKMPQFEVPQALIERELDKMEHELTVSLARMKLDRESYLAHLKMSMEDLRKKWHDQAVKRVKAALVLEKIAEQEGISASDEEVESRISELLQGARPEEISKINVKELQAYVRGIVRNEKVFDFLEKQTLEKA